MTMYLIYTLFAFTVQDQPCDTYLDLSDFVKGIVFLNNINLGRYWRKGPTLSLFIPAPYLKTNNEILVFEEFAITMSERVLKFSDKPVISHRKSVEVNDDEISMQ